MHRTPVKRLFRWPVGPILFLSLTLAGCSGQPIQPGAMVKAVAEEQAMVVPPPAGPGIVNIIERRYDNALEQEIHLYTSALTQGQNLIKVQLFGTTSPFRFASNNLTSTQVNERSMGAEMARAIPGVRMNRSLSFVQNSYGPFGYAFGHGQGADLCMYGWQQIRSPVESMSPVDNYGSIQIRVRICETGATEQKLLAFMYNFTINASVDAPGWNPYGNPAPLSSDIGRSGAPIYPRAKSTEQIVPPEPQKQSVVIRRSAAAAPRPRIAAPANAQPVYAMPRGAGAALPSTYPAAPQTIVPSPMRQSVSAAPATAAPAPVVSPAAPSAEVAPGAAARVMVPSPACSNSGGGNSRGGANGSCR